MKLLTMGEATRQTGIGARILRRAVADGRLPARRLDGWAYQIESDDLASFSLAYQVERLSSSARQRTFVADRPRAAARPSAPPSGRLHWLRMLLAGLRPAHGVPARGGGLDR